MCWHFLKSGWSVDFFRKCLRIHNFHTIQTVGLLPALVQDGGSPPSLQSLRGEGDFFLPLEEVRFCFPRSPDCGKGLATQHPLWQVQYLKHSYCTFECSIGISPTHYCSRDVQVYTASFLRKVSFPELQN